jgi:hypothetical protein
LAWFQEVYKLVCCSLNIFFGDESRGMEGRKAWIIAVYNSLLGGVGNARLFEVVVKGGKTLEKERRLFCATI